MLQEVLLKLGQFALGFVGIGLVLLFHEAGHFAAARLLGVRVETFGLGMGPKLFTIHGKNTDFVFSLVPFGGYCQMEGSIDLIKALRDDAKSFDKAEHGTYFTTTPLTRTLIFAAGPLANFLLSVLLFLAVSLIPADRAVNIPRIALVSDYPALFASDITQPELLSGDVLLEVDGVPVEWWEDASELIAASGKAELPLLISRGGVSMEVTAYGSEGPDGYLYGISLWQEPVVGRTVEGSPFLPGDRIISVNGDEVLNTYDLYVHAGSDMQITALRNGAEVEASLPATTSFPFAWESDLAPIERQGFLKSVGSSVAKTIDTIQTTFGTILSIFSRDMDPEAVRNEVTGPTRAAQTIGNITTLGFQEDTAAGVRAFLYLLSVVSISVCVANLIPIPTFDGGQIVINIWQMATGREMTPKAYVRFHIAGLVCTGLILVAMYALDFKHYFLS